MGVFDSLGHSGPVQTQQQLDQRQMQQQMQQELQQLKAGPGKYLKARGFNVPDGMTDAGQITQYLLQSGQVGNGRYQQVMRLLGGMRR